MYSEPVYTDRVRGTKNLQSSIEKSTTSRIVSAILQPLYKEPLVNTLRKGDILITGRGIGGLVGHAALMLSCDYVIEMPGGEGWQYGIEDNNRVINKHVWSDLHKEDWTSVYRNRDADVANAAAVWAEQTYYNPTGGGIKTQHITYKLTNDPFSIDPSYCSKLVVQAYHFGNKNKQVINNLASVTKFIVPSTIPAYFLEPYTLVYKGRF